MAKIPFGYILNPDGSIVPQIQATMVDLSANTPSSLITTYANNRFVPDSSNVLTHYDPTNYSMSFHADEDSSSNNFYNVSVNIPSPIYNDVGTYRYINTGYVPDYGNSVFLSLATGLPTTSPYKEKEVADFCDEPHSEVKQEKCQSLPSDQCQTSRCCVLLGGQKCVTGNAQGPHFISDYSDIFVTNRDYYYYLNKCYGRCQ
jgi:hypothetical protein